MSELWETTFQAHHAMWGEAPAVSAVRASEDFARAGVADVLIPGVGYGRNALPFLARGMAVTGIEISATAIELARSQLALEFPIHHGSVTAMPFDAAVYGGVFCYGLLYLLDAAARAKLLRDCAAQLAPGGPLVFTVISKAAPMYGRGPQLGEDWFEPHPGVPMFFYDAASIAREFAAYGVVEVTEIDEPSGKGAALPFLQIACVPGRAVR